MEFKIIKSLISIPNAEGKMHPELNIVIWDGREPVIDFRKWNDDHTKMSKGTTLTKDEAIKLFNIKEEDLS